MRIFFSTLIVLAIIMTIICSIISKGTFLLVLSQLIPLALLLFVALAIIYLILSFINFIITLFKKKG